MKPPRGAVLIEHNSHRLQSGILLEYMVLLYKNKRVYISRMNSNDYEFYVSVGNEDVRPVSSDNLDAYIELSAML